jgi:flagellar basal-body rod protein FlgG
MNIRTWILLTGLVLGHHSGLQSAGPLPHSKQIGMANILLTDLNLRSQGPELPPHGVAPVITAKIFTNGELISTDEVLDVAIQGDGFFKVTLPSGEFAYTRNGAFKTNSIGALTTSDGLALDGGIIVPEGARSIDISRRGEVAIVTADGTETLELQLHRFPNSAGLESMGRNLYRETDASGEAEEGRPNEQGFGALVHGYLEKSNVKAIEVRVNMIVMQRVYEIVSKSIKAADDIMETTNIFKR